MQVLSGQEVSPILKALKAGDDESTPSGTCSLIPTTFTFRKSCRDRFLLSPSNLYPIASKIIFATCRLPILLHCEFRILAEIKAMKAS